jgi:two-component system LytT family response regulator
LSIRTLIVDDEPLARQGIRQLLREESDIEVIGECAGGDEALAAIGQEKPDLMFLDVQMPRMDGFALLAALPDGHVPVIIFATAYDEHALEAFEVNAVDYLLKPLKPARFRSALQRARRRIQTQDLGVLNERLLALLKTVKPESPYPSHFAVRNGERTAFVKLADVDYIEAAANYAIVHTGTQNHVLRETLVHLESKLSPKVFLRIHRSAIVNLERVVGVKPAPRGEHIVVLKNGKELPLARNVREIQQRLEFL